MCTLSVSNVIYHKFSHGAAFYTFNGKNVNVMLESNIKWRMYYSKCVTMLYGSKSRGAVIEWLEWLEYGAESRRKVVI